MPCGVREGLAVWIVDGAAVRRKLYPEFVYGGNNQRYPFVPATEIWIDHAISVEEYGYTLAHELLERDLMAQKGLTYDNAHDSALALEHRMRIDAENSARNHEAALPRVSPTDCDGAKEIASLPDSIALRNIYRVSIPQHDSVSVWIVDGAVVRRDIFPDFGFSGNDQAYHFIPAAEIWIDNAIGCEDLDAAILAERTERKEMIKGAGYDNAYAEALREVAKFHSTSTQQIQNHPPLRFGPHRDRDIGTGR